ncbi:MAG TPA: hypothetical protein ENN63_08370 [Bacteroidetes bacterium]|nr:hypothetical protein [Bacteroidota bacterium]
MIHTVKIKRSATLLLLGFLLLVPVTGQQNNTLYFLKNNPAARYLNPAKVFRCNVFLGMPGFSSTYASFSNTLFNVEDVIFRGTGEYRDSMITIFHPSYDMGEFIAGLNKRSLLSPEVNVSLLSMGFRSKNTYVYLDVTERVTANVSLPRDLFAIALQGNGDFLGETADFSDLGINVNAFHEFGLGFAREVTPKLNIGFKPKVLLGVFNIHTGSPLPDIGLYTDPATFDLRFHSNLSLNVSAPIEITKNQEGEIDDITFQDIPDSEIAGTILNTKNLGLGLDLGMEYRVLDRLVVSASLIDLGYIHWGANTYNFKQDGSFEFTGFDLSEGLVANAEFDLDKEAEALLDSIAGLFQVTDHAQAYTTFLSPKLYLAGEYQLDDMLSFGVVSRSEFIGKKVRQSVTLSANAFLAKFFSLSLSYSMMNHTYDNLGAGVVIKGGPFHFYLITDRIPLNFTKIQATTEDFRDLDGFLLPNNFNSVNVRFGLNLVFGCRKRWLNDQPIILD